MICARYSAARQQRMVYGVRSRALGRKSHSMASGLTLQPTDYDQLFHRLSYTGVDRVEV